MSDGTHIEWTDASWSPLRARRLDGQPNKGGGGWSCQRVSPGCEHCYAETINKRLGTGFSYDAKGVAASEHYLNEKALLQPLRWKRGRRIFLSSMTDVFGEWVTDEQLDRIFAVMALSPQHTFQVLTKRAGRMREYVGRGAGDMGAEIMRIRAHVLNGGKGYPRASEVYWPLPNVWLGISAEDQQRWDERVPQLLATPAATRFVSYEPALGPIEAGLHPVMVNACQVEPRAAEALGAVLTELARQVFPQPDWVIIGGESGPKSRPFDIAWARSMIQQCQAADVSCFYKQGGKSNRCPHSSKGGCFECFPADLQVREFPHAV